MDPGQPDISAALSLEEFVAQVEAAEMPLTEYVKLTDQVLGFPGASQVIDVAPWGLESVRPDPVEGCAGVDTLSPDGLQT